MSYILSLSANSGTIYTRQAFDITKDVVVSFDYACYGSDLIGDEGFCVFFTNSLSALSGGGPGPGLGYTYVDNIYISSNTTAAYPGVFAGELGVGFDITGNFGTSAFGLSGLNTPVPNSISIRDSTINYYNLLYNSGPLSSCSTPFNIYQSVQQYYIAETPGIITYNRLRIRITDFGKRVIVDIKRPADDFFKNVVNVFLPNLKLPSSVYGGLSFATNLTNTHLKVKNFNINGFFTTNQTDDFNIYTYTLDSFLSKYAIFTPTLTNSISLTIDTSLTIANSGNTSFPGTVINVTPNPPSMSSTGFAPFTSNDGLLVIT